MKNIFGTFKEISTHVDSSLNKRFFAVVIMRTIAGGLDLFALAIIGFTVNAVISGRYQELALGELVLVQGQVMNEFNVSVMGAISLALFTLRGYFGYLTLKILRRIAISYEQALVEKVLDTSLMGYSGGSKGREQYPRVQHALTSARDWIEGGLIGFGVLLSEGLLVLMIFIAMTIASPISSAVLLVVLGLTALIIQRVMGPKMKANGTIQRDRTLEAMGALSTSLSMKAQLKTQKIEPKWLARITDRNKLAAKASGDIQLLSSLPRYILEVAVLVSVAAIVGFSYLVGDFADNASGAAVVLAGAFRVSGAIIPLQAAVNQITVARETGKAVLSVIDSEPEIIRPKSEQSVRDFLAEIAAIQHQDGSSKLLVLQGPSGAGKTTLINEVLRQMLESETQEFKLGFAGQDPVVIPGTFAQNVSLSLEPDLRLSQKTQELVQTLGLGTLMERWDKEVFANQNSVSISGGETTRLEILRAHQGEPSLVIMDEPTTGLDSATIKRLANFLNSQQETAYVMVTHDSGFIDLLKNPKIFSL